MSLNLSLKIEGAPDVKAMLNALGRDAEHAVRIAANDLGEHMQARMRNELPKRFTMRGTADRFRQAVVFQHAKVKNGRTLEAILKIGADGTAGTKASATKRLGILLARHEEADTRTSNAVYRMGSAVNRGQTFTGGFFLPAKGLRTSTTNVPRNLYPTSIGAQMRTGDGTGGSYFAKDKRKTKFSRKSGQLKLGESFYVIPGVGIFRRGAYIGPKQKGERGEAIWWFTRRVRTPARLGLWDVANGVFERHAIGYIASAIDTVLSRRG